MAEQTIKQRQHQVTNPATILLDMELGYNPSSNDLKIGDGSTIWASLPTLNQKIIPDPDNKQIALQAKLGSLPHLADFGVGATVIAGLGITEEVGQWFSFDSTTTNRPPQATASSNGLVFFAVNNTTPSFEITIFVIEFGYQTTGSRPAYIELNKFYFGRSSILDPTSIEWFSEPIPTIFGYSDINSFEYSSLFPQANLAGAILSRYTNTITGSPPTAGMVFIFKGAGSLKAIAFTNDGELYQTTWLSGTPNWIGVNETIRPKKVLNNFEYSNVKSFVPLERQKTIVSYESGPENTRGLAILENQGGDSVNTLKITCIPAILNINEIYPFQSTYEISFTSGTVVDQISVDTPFPYWLKKPNKKGLAAASAILVGQLNIGQLDAILQVNFTARSTTGTILSHGSMVFRKTNILFSKQIVGDSRIKSFSATIDEATGNCYLAGAAETWGLQAFAQSYEFNLEAISPQINSVFNPIAVNVSTIPAAAGLAAVASNLTATVLNPGTPTNSFYYNLLKYYVPNPGDSMVVYYGPYFGPTNSEGTALITRSVEEPESINILATTRDEGYQFRATVSSETNQPLWLGQRDSAIKSITMGGSDNSKVLNIFQFSSNVRQSFAIKIFDTVTTDGFRPPIDAFLTVSRTSANNSLISLQDPTGLITVYHYGPDVIAIQVPQMARALIEVEYFPKLTTLNQFSVVDTPLPTVIYQKLTGQPQPRLLHAESLTVPNPSHFVKIGNIPNVNDTMFFELKIIAGQLFELDGVFIQRFASNSIVSMATSMGTYGQFAVYLDESSGDVFVGYPSKNPFNTSYSLTVVPISSWSQFLPTPQPVSSISATCVEAVSTQV